VNRTILIAGIVVFTISAVFLAYSLCYAVWMTAYSAEPGPLRAWQVRSYMLLAILFLVCAADLYLVIKVIRNRKHQNVTADSS
jgi:type VI protein secretion system component VasK